MLERRFLSLAGIAGFVSVVLVAVSGFIAGTAPDADASPAEVREYLTDERAVLLVGGLLSLLAVLLFVVFAVPLAASLRQISGNLIAPALVGFGALLVATMSLAGIAAAQGLIWLEGFVEEAPDEVVRYAWNASN